MVLEDEHNDSGLFVFSVIYNNTEITGETTPCCKLKYVREIR